MIVALRCLLLTSQLALASEPESDPSTWTPPPLVQVPEAAVPRPAAKPPPAQSTLPPGALPPPAGSPFAPTPVPPPEGPEVGLMVTESLFGIVTAAGVCLIPYFLLRVVPGAGFGGTDDPTLQALILILTFSGVPLAVSQTEQSIAQGSRYYDVEGWPAPLGGLLTEAAVLGLYFWLRSQPGADAGATEIMLLTGTVLAVPLVEMGMINLFKVPRSQLPPPRAVFTTDAGGLKLGFPAPRPFASTAGGRPGLGVQVPILSGSF
jgi:hypothetical protein